MRRSPLLSPALVIAAASVALPQAPPLLRQFRAGDVERFRVELTARSEARGQRAEQIGQRAYAIPFSTFAEGRLAWDVTRRVVTVAADGTAEIEEVIVGFSPLAVPPGPDEEGKTDAALRLALIAWAGPRRLVLHYRESPRGEIRGLGDDAAPTLDAAPAVLTLWLRRALRPATALRGSRGGADARWSEPRAASLPPWTEAHGSETGEWQPGPPTRVSSLRLDNLLLTQEITAIAPAVTGTGGSGQARFHAESLATVVAAGVESFGRYGSVTTATRSASRELRRNLDPVPGLAEPPVFSSRISVEVRITSSLRPPG
jgi:hypothetical protein